MTGHGGLKTRLLAKAHAASNGCWEWQARKDADGYGRIWVNSRVRSGAAHRVSYEVHCGAIPEGMHVLHRCDNRACINPDHLFLGTNFDNMADRNSKGRQRRGAGHGRAKLSEADVSAIRSSGASGVEIAARFGMSESQVSRIRKGSNWKCVGVHSYGA
ncbi:DNA-binding CsgD family transcriptional regulator [Bradyrhizobium sp. USDA 4472]